MTSPGVALHMLGFDVSLAVLSIWYTTDTIDRLISFTTHKTQIIKP